MSDDQFRKNSDDLKKRPARRGSQSANRGSRTSSGASRRQDESNDIFSYSTIKKSKRDPALAVARKRLIIFNVITSLILVFSILTFGGALALDMNLLKKPSVDEEETGDFDDLVRSTDENVVYFLLCGIDLSENLSDIIMVVCYDLDNNQASIMQIPRDTFVGDVSSGKVNAVYGSARKGESKINALIRVINQKFGLPIDHYLTVTIDGAEKVIDTIGGVDLKLDYEMKLVDDTGDSDVVDYFGPGEVHLDGQWSVAFVRHRSSYNAGDLGRVRAQRKFYAALMKKFINMGFGDITGIVTNCMDEISSDLTLGQILGYAQKLHNIEMDDVQIMSVPGQADYYHPDGYYYASYYSIHKQEYVDLVNQYMLPYEKKALTVEAVGIPEIHSSYSSGYNSILQGGSLSEFDTESETTTTSDDE